jgi:hypothetical protein
VSGTTLNWIDAEWLTAATICPSRNPANNNVVGQFADGGQAMRTRRSGQRALPSAP